MWGAGSHGQLGRKTERGAPKNALVPQLVDIGAPVRQVACGGAHTACCTDNGHVFAWGDGRCGQLGFLKEGHNMQPVPGLVATLADLKVFIVQVGYGSWRTRTPALSTATGRLRKRPHGLCHRYRAAVRMGPLEERPDRTRHDDAGGSAALLITMCAGDRGAVRTPKLVECDATFVSVSCGHRHTAALSSKGRVYTFGSGEHGQLGTGRSCLRPRIAS